MSPRRRIRADLGEARQLEPPPLCPAVTSVMPEASVRDARPLGRICGFMVKQGVNGLECDDGLCRLGGTIVCLPLRSNNASRTRGRDMMLKAGLFALIAMTGGDVGRAGRLPDHGIQIFFQLRTILFDNRSVDPAWRCVTRLGSGAPTY